MRIVDDIDMFVTPWGPLDCRIWLYRRPDGLIMQCHEWRGENAWRRAVEEWIPTPFRLMPRNAVLFYGPNGQVPPLRFSGNRAT
jgi:hypothetical protein